MQNKTILPNDTSIQFDGNAWVSTESCAFMTCSAGDSVSFTFTGTAIYFLSGLSNGTVQIVLDKDETIIQMSLPLGFPNSTCTQNILFYDDNMENTSHSIKADVMGGSSSSDNCLSFTGFMYVVNCCVLPYFKLTHVHYPSVTTEDSNGISTNTPSSSSQALLPDSSSNTSSPTDTHGLSTGVIAGIVFGAVAAVLIMFGGVAFLCRRNRPATKLVNIFGNSTVNHVGGNQTNMSTADHIENWDSYNQRHSLNFNSRNAGPVPVHSYRN
ncbi:hypothetical protein BDQ17DRAFT_1358998 [Cyathus striatus]|nr:hypothetical protein BDQ17DRAFT_1358998 [Cyathus striatus]